MRVRRQRVDVSTPGAPRAMATVFRSGRWWIGWVDAVSGVNGQERSRTALLATLRLTMREALEFDAAC